MSEAIQESKVNSGEPVDTDDVRRMLDEMRAGRAELDRQLAEERAARSRLERERDELAGHAGTAAEQRYVAEMQAADGAIDSAGSEIDRAEEAHAAALEAGDHRAVSKANRAMQEAIQRQAEARNRKQYLEANKAQLTARPAVQRSGDKYDGLVDGIRPEERRWLDDRPQFLSDQKYQRRVYNAAGIAEAEGLGRGSEAYLHRMEEILGEVKRSEDEPAPAPRERGGVSADVAPARRPAPGQSTGRQEIRLTADEREIADGLYGNPGLEGYIADEAERYKKYHGNKQRMIASGRLG